jgi:hypothetical protein
MAAACGKLVREKLPDDPAGLPVERLTNQKHAAVLGP